MADSTTITRYLKLRLAADLSADARYNLLQIDQLGATFTTDNTATLNIKSVTDILAETNAPSLGGGGDGTGTFSFGTADNLINILAKAVSFKSWSPLSIRNGSSPTDTYLSLASVQSQTSDYTLTIDTDSGDRTVTFAYDGETVTVDATQTLTNKDITGVFSGPLTGNVTGNVTGNLTGNVTGNVAGNVTGNVTGNLTGNVTGNVSGSATTFTDPLVGDVTGTQSATVVSTVGGVTAANVASGATLANAATDANTASTIIKRDSSGNFTAGTITATLNGLATNVSGTVALANGGTGASTKEGAQVNLLPSYSGKALSLLRVNMTEDGIEWATGAGAGTVTIVNGSAPITVSGDPTANPTIGIDLATSSADGYLSSTDWTTFNSKEPPITAGTTAQYWRGDKSWQTLDKSAVGLSNVDNTSDANKPISSATQTALNAKYDASNPAGYVNASGAKTAAVVNSTAGNETDQAPSVSAVKAYVAAQAGGALSYTWTNSDGATKAISHSLNKLGVTVTIFDASGEDILVDTVTRTTLNSVSLASSVAPPIGADWTVVIRP